MAGKRKYSDDEKQAALALCEELESVAEAARALSIPYRTLIYWRRSIPHNRSDRGADGRFVPGKSGNPGGRSTARARAERIAADACPDAMVEIVELFQDLTSGDKRRRNRAKELLSLGTREPHVLKLAGILFDRGMGRPSSGSGKEEGNDSGLDMEEGVGGLYYHHYGAKKGEGPDIDADLEAADASG